MKSIEKILLPIDVSGLVVEALTYAANLARRFDAALQIIYVDQPLTYVLPEGYALASPDTVARRFANAERTAPRRGRHAAPIRRSRFRRGWTCHRLFDGACQRRRRLHATAGGPGAQISPRVARSQFLRADP